MGTGAYGGIAEVLDEASRRVAARAPGSSTPSRSTTFCRAWLRRRELPRISRSPRAAIIRARSASSRSCAGAFRSRGEESILAEARALAAGGTNELILIAQDTSMYGRDRGARRGGFAAVARDGCTTSTASSGSGCSISIRRPSIRELIEAIARCPRSVSTWTCRCSTRIPRCCGRCCGRATASAIWRFIAEFRRRSPGSRCARRSSSGFRRTRRARRLSRGVAGARGTRPRRLLRIQLRGRHAGASLGGKVPARERRKRLVRLREAQRLASERARQPAGRDRAGAGGRTAAPAKERSVPRSDRHVGGLVRAVAGRSAGRGRRDLFLG